MADTKVPYDPTATKTFRFHFHSPVIEDLPGPAQIFWSEIRLLLQKSYLLLDLLRPFWTTNPEYELDLEPPNGWAVIYTAVVSVVQAPALLGLIGLSLIVITTLHVLGTINELLLWKDLQGPPMQVWPPDLPARYNEKDRWIYINGIATGKTIIRQNLQVLSARFNAPVLGINNRTHGVIADLIACIFQRSFDFETKETRWAVPIIERYLRDRTHVDKVVLVAHSQGGLLASGILQQLYDEVGAEDLHGRLEVYTFGNAALTFKNPVYDERTGARVVTHIEHYCHEKDLVCQYGALASVNREETPFFGRVFVAQGKTGHLLNQHYLSEMFTGPSSTWGAENFLLQKAVPADNKKGKDRYLVYDKNAGEREGAAVKDLSNLWKYME